MQFFEKEIFINGSVMEISGVKNLTASVTDFEFVFSAITLF